MTAPTPDPTAGEGLSERAWVDQILALFPMDNHGTGHIADCGYDTNGERCDCYTLPERIAAVLAARESAAATRARAEGDRLRERVERLADDAEWRAETSLSRTFTGETFGAWVSAADLRTALAPDEAGESA